MPDDRYRSDDSATMRTDAPSRFPPNERADEFPIPARLHALDAVRGFALLLGIVFHATMSFVPSTTKIWIVEDSHRSTALAALCFSLHVFRLTTFFLIAGLFAHLSFHRRGAKAFIVERLKRIALPLVVGWPFVFAALYLAWADVFTDGGLRPVPAFHWPAFPSFPLTHLWFLYVLLEFYAGALILRAVLGYADRGDTIRRGIDRIVRLTMRNLLGPVLLALPLGVAFAADPKWLMWFGVVAPDRSLVTNAQALVGYGTAFGFGWLLHRQADLLAALERHWSLNLLLAGGLTALSLWIAGVTPPATPLDGETVRLAGAGCYALASWTATFALIGIALRFLSGYSAARRYVADASYWLYLVHLPLVVALQVGVSRFDWPWPAKFATILGVTFPLLFASYHLVARHSVIGAVLNGRRMGLVQ